MIIKIVYHLFFDAWIEKTNRQQLRQVVWEGIMELIFFVISFCASVIGVICGIGGGVIIKPVLDAFGILSVSAISFLSGCTVLSMSCYSVVKSRLNKESVIDWKISTYLGIGAVVGGIVGKQGFQIVKSLFSDADMVGAVQAAILGIITLGTLIYTVYKKKIRTLQLTSKTVCILIGLILGIFSSFLGIGGGPINLVVLYFFFSMETKVAAQNSLYIILLSQISSLVSTIVTGTVPQLSLWILVGMVLCGIGGSAVGRKINAKISSDVVDKLFMGLMGVIIAICVYNMWRFL